MKPFPEQNEIEANGYPPTMVAPSLSTPNISTNSPAILFPQSDIEQTGTSSVLRTGELRSINYKTSSSGWNIRVDGTSELNQATIIVDNPVVSTNFRKIISSTTGFVLWESDGTTPDGNLSGTAGDICVNGASNKPYYCMGTTNWTALV